MKFYELGVGDRFESVRTPDLGVFFVRDINRGNDDRKDIQVNCPNGEIVTISKTDEQIYNAEVKLL